MQENQNSEQISHVPQAAAQIAVGALCGGVHGAAIAAAQQTAPVVIKFVAGILGFAVILPMLIFVSIPCYLFGFDSATATDVVQMTRQAAQVSDMWKQQREYEDQTIAGLTAGKSDILSVQKSLGNTNDYWMTAITSVAFQQDVRQITSEQILTILKAKMLYEFLPQYDADNQFTGFIFAVTDMTPDELMDKLDFTEQQKQWAGVLYETMADEEVGEPEDGISGSVDYGDVTFTGRGNATEVVYYHQGDSRWGSQMYGRTGTVKSSGCGPSCMAIVISSLTDTQINPGQMCDWAYQNGYRCEGSGSYHSLIPGAAKAFDIPCEGLGRSRSKLVEALQNGKLVVAIMSKGHFTRGGHYIVLRGITEDGKILVADPASYQRSEQMWNVDIFLAECNKRAGAGGPFWALG